MAGKQPRARFSLRAAALVVLGLLACLAGPSAQAAVLGIDFGTDWFTIALANPGRPLDLVLNRDANRQTASVVAVNGLERTFGSNAVAIAPRYPLSTFMAVRNLLGVSYDSDVAAAYREQFPNKMVRHEQTGGVAFEYGALANETLTVQEIVAMQLRHAQQLVKESEGIAVTDAVLTVPSFFDRKQRQALLDAAGLAGLRTIALVNDGSAVALNYAMGRSFTKQETHLFYDMGAGKTVATVAGIYARAPGKQSTSKKATVINVHAFAADKMLGGLEADFAMRDLLVAKFAASSSLPASDIRGSARAMNRLLKEAKRVKTILSVNAETVASVEGLLGGIDFRAGVTRDEFEQASAHLVPRIRTPVDQALSAANLTIADIDSIVLVGGGSRVPFVQRALAEAFGSDKISRNVNAEEACVMGAVFKGATLSSHFRVRDMRLRDAMSHAVRATYQGETKSLLGGAKQETAYLYPEFGAVGVRRSIRTIRGSDMEIEFEAKASGSSQDWQRLATAKVSGVSTAQTKLKSKQAVSDKSEVKVVVQTNELGFFEVIKAEATFNVTNPGHAAYLEDLAAWEKESAAFGTESETEPSAASSDADADAESGGAKKKKAKAKTSLRARPAAQPEIISEVVPLDLTIEYHETGKLDKAGLQKSRDLLKRMDSDDEQRFARHHAVNQLETLIYHVRDIVDDEDTEAVTNQEQRRELADAADKAAEWLESNGESAAIDVIEAEALALKSLEEPVLYRRAQAASRSTHIKSLEDILTQVEGVIANYRKDHGSEVLEAIKDELHGVEDALDGIASWLREMVSKQEALQAHQDPVLTTEEMDKKASAIEQSLAKLMLKAVNEAKKIKKAASSKGDSAKTAANNDDDDDDDGDDDYVDGNLDNEDEDIKNEGDANTSKANTGSKAGAEEQEPAADKGHDEL
ncbi:lumenal Hsp70 protein [Coemansia sp. Benny D115]|nr:lumenal Hsp70 protein [Coemansia sp. Benny D115]